MGAGWIARLYLLLHGICHRAFLVRDLFLFRSILCYECVCARSEAEMWPASGLPSPLPFPVEGRRDSPDLMLGEACAREDGAGATTCT